MKKALVIGLALLAALAAVISLAVMLGAESLPVMSMNQQQSSIFYEIRLPRVLLAACVGGSLAVVGDAALARARSDEYQRRSLDRPFRKGPTPALERWLSG